MPEGASQEERTESATPRRREEARKKGQVAKSMDLTSAFMFLVALVTIRFAFPSIFSGMMDIMKASFSALGDKWLKLNAGSPEASTGVQDPILNIQKLSLSTLVIIVKSFAPFAMAMIVSALFINYIQVGFIVSSEALSPKFERINPVKGFSRLVSKRTIVAFVQSLFKILIVGYVLYITAKGEKGKIINLADMPINLAVAETTSLMFKMGYRVALLLFILSAFDYAYQRWEYERGLRMTKQEVKEEMKQSEGDPLIKARIRSIQREMARRRMMQEVPKADIIITNPTTLAVALKYDPEVDAAPKVCAKGARIIAEKIKAIAQEYGIPIIEDKPLAQALYELEIGWEIPVALYRTVAEILARIYQSSSFGKASSLG